MRIVKFAKWWWKRNDEFERTITCTGLFWVLPCFIASIWFGKYAFLAAVIGIIAVLVGWTFYGIFYGTRQLWRTFNDEHPPEDIAVIRKLKGIPTPSRKEEVFYD
jgi:hypothetical protein